MAAQKKQLAKHVHVDGKAYGPSDDVPASVAKKITNPKAWAQPDKGNPEAESDEDADKASTENDSGKK